MTQYPNRFWLIILLLGVMFDFLFWGHPAGVNFALFIMEVLIGGFYLLIVNGRMPALKSLFLLIPVAFFACTTFFRQETLTVFLAYVFALFSLCMLAVTYQGGRWVQYSLADYVSKFVELGLLGLLSGPIVFFADIRKQRAERGEAKKASSIAPVLRGLLIAFPVVIFFASLLGSADLVFSQKMGDFFEMFKLERGGEYFFRLILMLFWAYVLGGAFLYAASRSRDENLKGEQKPLIPSFMGFTESSIVLGSVIILFILFVMVQFQYFFGGNANIGVTGYTYSQYARRGFNELVIVAFFSLLMMIGLSTITKREGNLQGRVYSSLNVGIVVLVLIILASAYQRLALAVDWHGFSRLRVYPQVFLVWVGILFVAVVVLEVLRKERYFAFAAVLASLGFAASLSLFNVDDAIVRQNVLRASQGKHFNPAYLATLSFDAVPALADKFLDTTLPTEVHEAIGAALLCYSDALSDDSADDWRSFTLSRSNAEKTFMAVKPQLVGYDTRVSYHVLVSVRTPGKVLYQCFDSEPNIRD